jgi:hypothetical protein
MFFLALVSFDGTLIPHFQAFTGLWQPDVQRQFDFPFSFFLQ